MAVKTAYRTVIVCDGANGKCPDEAVLDIGQAPNAAIRRAGKSGWSMTDEHLCPVCQGSAVADVITLPRPHVPLRPHEVLRPAGTVHLFKTRSEKAAGISDPSCPYVCQRLTA